MNTELLQDLRRITDEEQAILDGQTSIDRTLYMQGRGNTVNRHKLLELGKRITLRTHTRFIDFPEHIHNYVEMVYMCEGKTVHTVNGTRIELKKGELLFLNQHTTHAVARAGERDIAVNFIVLPDFFTSTLSVMGEEETPLRRFILDCLSGQNTGMGYLHFQVAHIPPIQNLVENLMWTLMRETPHRRVVAQTTMTLLFLQLLGCTETLTTVDHQESTILKALQYVESEYVSGSLSDLAAKLHYDVCGLSREIKRKTGKTYTQIVQEKRLAQAAFLLRHTNQNVSDISVAVGYENVSYFHRLFVSVYGKSPKHYRDDT